jgi:hypothetical protein
MLQDYLSYLYSTDILSKKISGKSSCSANHFQRDVFKVVSQKKVFVGQTASAFVQAEQ